MAKTHNGSSPKAGRAPRDASAGTPVDAHVEDARTAGSPTELLRRYIRDTRTTPLLTREREMILGREMERGRLRARSLLARSLVVARFLADEVSRLRAGRIDVLDLVEPFDEDPMSVRRSAEASGRQHRALGGRILRDRRHRGAGAPAASEVDTARR